MINLQGIILPNSLQWTDEYQSDPVSQSVKRTLAGSIVVYHGVNRNGRPISLESTVDSGWMKKSVVDQVKLISLVAGGVYSLTIRGVTYNVMFRHHERNAFEATPIIPSNVPVADDYYLVKIRLMTV